MALSGKQRHKTFASIVRDIYNDDFVRRGCGCPGITLTAADNPPRLIAMTADGYTDTEPISVHAVDYRLQAQALDDAVLRLLGRISNPRSRFPSTAAVDEAAYYA